MARKKSKKSKSRKKSKKPVKKAKGTGKKYVYFFGGGRADGKAEMKNLLGGKGANLAEMANLGIPVPPGFTITTAMCTAYYDLGRKYPRELAPQVDKAMARVEKIMDSGFGDTENPLLVSVRSGARKSMPGMMETILNVGLTTRTIPGLINKTRNERFVYDAYRRLMTMYSDVVMEKAAGVEVKEGMGIRAQLEEILEKAKEHKGVKEDTGLGAEDLKAMIPKYKAKIKEMLGKEFPDDPREQLWGAIGAVFASWMGRRAIEYRRIEKIPGEWGTAVNVQSMVFGNMGDTSATGVGFTRDPATGANIFYGEWLPNAQGEDVVAGTRTPLPVNEAGKTEHSKNLQSLEKAMPGCYVQLDKIQKKLEKHYTDMLDIEFTIQEDKLWMLQCRVGKRNGVAAVKMAVDMCRERLISKKEAISRVSADALIQCLLPMVDPDAERSAVRLAKGLPAGPGGAAGMVVFTADEAARRGKDQGEKVILVRNETSPEDVHGMHAAQAILTAKGGMTSHAALVARGWGKCCIVGCGDVQIKLAEKSMRIGDKVMREGEWITLNGTAGYIYDGKLDLISPDIEANKELSQILKWVDEFRKLRVRTNADTPKDAQKAIQFGAEGIGLFRIEHMFYGAGSDEPLFKLRKMIMSKTEQERRAALNELFPFMKADIKATLEVMDGRPVTIRLLDPPLHEFVPHRPEARQKLAGSLNIDAEEMNRRADGLQESNPMMGHRGVRLGVSYPEITEIQARAILEASAELLAEGKKAFPEIMIPVLSHVNEFKDQKAIVEKVYAQVVKKYGLKKLPHLVGTMIEIPRAALTAGKIAAEAEFFSYGTNDLTQMGFGFSRDDIGGFLPHYLERKILPDDPFATVDVEGIGELIQIGIQRGRKARPKLKIGICGEHGGDAASVIFCHKAGMDYVSCSPFRLPIARLAAAHAVIGE
jgi:pyruvate,orthophosphate dikinase